MRELEMNEIELVSGAGKCAQIAAVLALGSVLTATTAAGAAVIPGGQPAAAAAGAFSLAFALGAGVAAIGDAFGAC
jgi:hypothetical protein